MSIGASQNMHCKEAITHVICTLCLLGFGGIARAQLSDPMAPPGTTPAGSAESSRARSTPSDLQGVLSGPGRRLALIDGSVVQEGGTVPGNGELISIGPDSATVRSGGKDTRLRLHPGLTRKDSIP